MARSSSCSVSSPSSHSISTPRIGGTWTIGKLLPSPSVSPASCPCDSLESGRPPLAGSVCSSVWGDWPSFSTVISEGQVGESLPTMGIRLLGTSSVRNRLSGRRLGAQAGDFRERPGLTPVSLIVKNPPSWRDRFPISRPPPSHERLSSEFRLSPGPDGPGPLPPRRDRAGPNSAFRAGQSRHAHAGRAAGTSTTRRSRTHASSVRTSPSSRSTP